MAHMIPPVFPHDIIARPYRAGEKAVYDALHAALSDDWLVAYDRPIPGSKRRLDFVVLHPEHGLAAIEVKGGQVHAKRGRFLQLIRSKPGAAQRRKRVDPFAQAKLALCELLNAAAAQESVVPVHIAMALPLMRRSAFTWQPTPHILTREMLEPLTLLAVLTQALPLGSQRPDEGTISRIATLLRS